MFLFKDIKKNDSSFERHDQYLAAVQASYLVNMFDNFHEKYPDRLEGVANTEDAVKFVLDLLDEFHVKIYYDPDTHDQGVNLQDGEDDLFEYCQVSNIR